MQREPVSVVRHARQRTAGAAAGEAGSADPLAAGGTGCLDSGRLSRASEVAGNERYGVSRLRSRWPQTSQQGNMNQRKTL